MGRVSKYEAITPDIVASLLDYDAESGILLWKRRPIEIFPSKRVFSTWNSRFAGKPALNASLNGRHKTGTIFYRHFLAHRVVWCLCRGEWPKEDIDHINGDGMDNRIENLRECSMMENQWNKSAERNSTSKYKGVSWCKLRYKWYCNANLYGKTKFLGRFDREEDAAIAYNNYVSAHHGEFFRPNILEDSA